MFIWLLWMALYQIGEMVLAWETTDAHWLTFNDTTPVIYANIQECGVVITASWNNTLSSVTFDNNTDCTIAYLYTYSNPYKDVLLQTWSISSHVATFDYQLTWWNDYVIACNKWSWVDFNIWFYNTWASPYPITWTNLIWKWWYNGIIDSEDLESVISIKTNWTTPTTWNTNNFFHFFN